MVASIGDLKIDLIRSCLALFTVAVVCPHKILRGKVLSLRSPGSAGGPYRCQFSLSEFYCVGLL